MLRITLFFLKLSHISKSIPDNAYLFWSWVNVLFSYVWFHRREIIFILLKKNPQAVG